MTDAYLDDRHAALAGRVRAFGDERLRGQAADEDDPPRRTHELALALAEAGILGAAVPPPHGFMDLRSLVTVREGLAYYSTLADRAFATQGLGSFAIAHSGTEVQRNRWLPEVVGGRILCAFALTEPEAGSDLAGLRTRAYPDGAIWRLDGTKTLIANAGIAGLYTVVARTAVSGPRAFSVFLVDAEAPGIAGGPPRGGHGQAVRHRGRAADRGSRRADPRRPGRAARRHRGAALPRGARAAHRGRDERDAEAAHRAPPAQGGAPVAAAPRPAS